MTLSNKCIVADASPLIGLARIHQLDVLTHLFSEILIPDQVAKECTEDRTQPGAEVIAKAIKCQLLTVRIIAVDELLYSNLDPGELAAITLAKKLDCPILLDDRQARSIARGYGLTILGLGGLLVIAKRRKIIRKVKLLLDDLHRANYFLSKNLVEEILALAKEETSI